MRNPLRLTAGLLAAAALGSCSMFDYSGMVVHKFALVYGVTNYVSTTDTHWSLVQSGAVPDPNLSYPDADAKSMASMLRQQGYDVIARWVDSNGEEWLSTNTISSPSVSLGNIQSDTSGANGPSKANIRTDISTYFSSKVGPDDLFLFYFSGHGMQDAISAPPHEYFVPVGAMTWSPSQGEYAAYESLSVRDDEFGSFISPLKTPRKVVILDTCNSGGFVGNKLEVDSTSQLYTGSWPLVTPATLAQAISNYASFQDSPTGLSPYGAQVLSAAGSDESSYEWSVFPNGTPLAHGVMTYFLLETVASADLNHDGLVTVLEAFAFVKAGIEQNWNPYYLSSRQAFEPHVSGGPVDFVLF